MGYAGRGVKPPPRAGMLSDFPRGREWVIPLPSVWRGW